MSTAQASNAHGCAKPPIPVWFDGEMIKRVSVGDAEQLVSLCWAEWIGRGRRRYIRLTESAPVSSLGWSLVGNGTRPIRADHTCSQHGDGQLMGDRQKLREFPNIRG